MTLTVHMIANAHLDPVWLWSWQRGADEAAATCRVACELLDEEPELVYTRGEAWVYEMVRIAAPDVFARIRKHIDSGRWQVVNGWWVQPDCNIPSLEALRLNAAVGFDWFKQHLGISDIPVAYNVDTFGHGANLPRLFNELQQPYYVMMRPGPGELELPAHLFRWRCDSGEETLVFRINGEYIASNCERLERNINNAIAARQDGVDHVMCFYGVGNHGGGPTRSLIKWIHEHKQFAEGVELKFSSPSQFFEVVKDKRKQCPVVDSELQFHAIGCYSVCADFKRLYRRAEQQLLRYQDLLNDDLRTELQRDLAFAQFHDILPGSSIPTATEASTHQVGSILSRLDHAIYAPLRLKHGSRSDSDPVGHRVHLLNTTQQRWQGLTSCEIWTDWQPWNNSLLDAEGNAVPVQLSCSERISKDMAESSCPRLFMHCDVAPGEQQLFVIGEQQTAEPALEDCATLTDNIFSNGVISVHCSEQGIAQIVDETKQQDLLKEALQFIVQRDSSDTWSHSIDRYDDAVLASASFGPAELVEQGPLFCRIIMQGSLLDMPVLLEAVLERDNPVLQVRLHCNYNIRFSILKAVLTPIQNISGRRDRVAGGWIERPCNGQEYPVNHALQVHSGDTQLGLVLPDSFAVDVDDERVRPTLLRNNVHAFHNGRQLAAEDFPIIRERPGTDSGEQNLRIFICPNSSEQELEALRHRLQQPLECWDDYHKVSRLARHEKL